MIKVNFLGEGVTEGECIPSQDKQYVSLIGKEAGFLALNYGNGGARVTYWTNAIGEPYNEYDFIKKAKMMEDADFVCIFGRTNNYGRIDCERL